MFTIALVNQKGGVGKSTTAVNLSAGLARLGKRVLLIDLDPQGHSTLALGFQPRQMTTSIYSLLSGSHKVREVIRPAAENLWIIPSTIDLAGGEAELAARPHPHFILRNAMAELGDADFDFAIVDSPPQLGFLNVNSLAWVREVFIPVQCEFYALHGLALLMNTIDRVRAQLNPALQVSAVIPCQVNPRRALTRDVLAELEKHFPGRVLKTRIRVNVRLAEAPGHGKSIFDYAPESNGAIDYGALAAEVVALPPPAPWIGALPVAEIPVAPKPEPVVETPVQAEPGPEPVVVEAPQFEPIIVAEPEPEPVEVAFAEVAPREPEPVRVPIEAAAPTPVANGTPLTEPGSFAHKLAMAGLRPIVVRRPGMEEVKREGGLTQKILGKLFGKK
ncbi:MAG TPA: AAA family ATPase [Planctomycetota bacterium]|nr:AAA family ATPase [Planctomycetota bacterium]